MTDTIKSSLTKTRACKLIASITRHLSEQGSDLPVGFDQGGHVTYGQGVVLVMVQQPTDLDALGVQNWETDEAGVAACFQSEWLVAKASDAEIDLELADA